MQKFNAQDPIKYLIKEKNIVPLSGNLVTKVYDRLRDIVTKYLYVVYETEILGKENEGGFYSVDESMFGHTDGTQTKTILSYIESTLIKIIKNIFLTAATIMRFSSLYKKDQKELSNIME